MMMTEKEIRMRMRERESAKIQEAMRKKEYITYKDEDGCEVTATPSGHAFYNAADWW
jgi:hypothetical protein